MNSDDPSYSEAREWIEYEDAVARADSIALVDWLASTLDRKPSVTANAVLTDSAIEAIAAAVFAVADAWVAEAHSDVDALPREFAATSEFVSYTSERLAKPRGSASFFVTYPDMRGRAVRQTIQVTSGGIPAHSRRYTWEGWGLICVLLTRGDQPNDASRVTANSEKRALKWAATYPGMESPGTWNWRAVASHERRLRRVLRQVTQ